MGPHGLAMGWSVDRCVGSAEELFGQPFDAFPTRTVRFLQVTAPAIVLGAAQSVELVLVDEARRHGVDVVKRRSGGGAVWLDDGMTWVDVVLQKDDPLWSDDVGKAFLWLGNCWSETVSSLVKGSEAVSVHNGALAQSSWSKLVCFGGLGPGEVSLGGRKVVGVSQKRTRSAALFQCGVLHAWDPSQLLRFLVPTQQPEEARLAAEDLVWRCTTVPKEDVVDRFVQALARLDS